MKNKIWKTICAVRENSPLVLNITNFVVMNNTANALLAAGASPIMAHSTEEVEDMASLCAATVINIGTLDEQFVAAMKLALKSATNLGKPTVLDPVGAGATPYRNRVLKELLDIASLTFIRGNAGEIMTLAGIDVVSKGVDSTVGTDKSMDAGRQLAASRGAVVSISGEVDIITNGKQVARIDNGDQMMCSVTGLGCTSSALLGAFAAVEKDPFTAAVSAAAFMAVTGEMAAAESIGPGSLQVNLLDIMFTLTERQFMERIRVTVE